MHDQAAVEVSVILASASTGRADILRQAGLNFEQRPASLNEREIEAKAKAEGNCSPAEIATILAAAKAEAVSCLCPKALVIGADQLMACEGELFSKPLTIQAARDQLKQLRGKTHSLHSGLALARQGKTIWQHHDQADLTMRDFSDAFLDAYCAQEGEEMLSSVGAYRIEGPGIQLFSHIRGDHFTIIGLPMLPLLGYLRSCGYLAA